MSTDSDEATRDLLERLFAQHDERGVAIQELYIMLRNGNLLPQLTLHKYMCRRGCQIATVFRAAGLTLCWVRDYKFSPGLNEARSVETARVKNTIDGDRHWPGHVYDVAELNQFSVGKSRAGADMNCRHRRGIVFAEDILAAVEGVQPGYPRKPTLL